MFVVHFIKIRFQFFNIMSFSLCKSYPGLLISVVNYLVFIQIYFLRDDTAPHLGGSIQGVLLHNLFIAI